MNQPLSNSSELQNRPSSQDISTKREDLPGGSEIPQKDDEFLAAMLAGVSRTFALTIPRLPESLRKVISNAYLLCRIVDTIEDEPNIPAHYKSEFCELFLEILESGKDPNLLISRLTPMLSHHIIPAEQELIRQLHRVVRITKSFSVPQQKALVRCVRIMSEGMIYFQRNASPRGLKDQQEMDKYCYHVAGVVGEMLTELFCLYSTEIACHRQEMFNLSSSFGQGLQMTNILKDIWDDQKRGACWLPRDLFEKKGLDLRAIETLSDDIHFQQGLKQLVAIVHYHLENALKYTLLIPSHEKGIREFCLWALGMAMLTIRKIYHNPGFTASDQVKISRNSVKATVAISGLAVKHDYWLKFLFQVLSRGLPITIPFNSRNA